MKLLLKTAAFAVLAVLLPGSAFALIVPFTETFNTNASNWLNGASAAPTYNATGGVGDSGYISYTAPLFTSGTTGGMGDPTQLMFRANDSANASGDAFVGNWISGGVITLSLAVRHNYTSDLNFYVRIAPPSSTMPFGTGASLANDIVFAIAPNTWTTITIPIVNSTSSFVSYGAAGTPPNETAFNAVFSNVQNMQLGLYLPASTEFSNLTMGIDNVALTVPEPTSTLLAALGLGLVALRRRRKI